jgi:hypothetical protein
MRRLLASLAAGVMIALASATGAGAWSQLYAFNLDFWPGDSRFSAWNGLTQNYIRWDNRYGGYPSVGLRYCRTDRTCTSYVWKQTPGVFYDTRTIAYGQGECHAYGGNNYILYVYECRVSNG